MFPSLIVDYRYIFCRIRCSIGVMPECVLVILNGLKLEKCNYLCNTSVLEIKCICIKTNLGFELCNRFTII